MLSRQATGPADFRQRLAVVMATVPATVPANIRAIVPLKESPSGRHLSPFTIHFSPLASPTLLTLGIAQASLALHSLNRKVHHSPEKFSPLICSCSDTYCASPSSGAFCLR